MDSMNQYLTEPDDDLKCIICFEIAKDPTRHGDCGKLFCSECIQKNGNRPCPNCRTEKPQFFPDGKSLREIKALRVRCDNAGRGCVWEGTVGTLGGHVTKCDFNMVSCPNKCKVEGEDIKLMRKDLEDHLKTICPNRNSKCVYCQKKGTYISITEEHDSVCIRKVVSCPNTKCTSTMQRGSTKRHLETCEYTVLDCKYVSIGCRVKMMRMDMKKHREDDKHHFSMALEKIMKLEKTTSSLEGTTSALKKHFDILKREKLVTFSLSIYSKKKEGSEIFCPEPFYTSPGGYKIRIAVFSNGSGAGKGTHVSVLLQVLGGPNDDNISWPFLGTVTIELLNQLTDDNHRYTKITFNITHNIQVGDQLCCNEFVPHTELSHNQTSNTQYLMEDTLYFRVAVKVDHHYKPWLDCTDLPQKTTNA